MTNDWQTTSIGEVAKPIERAEAPMAGTTYRQIGVRLWGQGAYERESIDGSQTKYATLSRVESGDIVVNKIWARNGSVAVVSDKLSGCFGSGEFPTFAPDRKKLDPRWFHWITKTKWFWQACDVKSQGTSGKNRIRPEKFLEIEIPLPPLDEQRRILGHIEALAAYISKAQSLRDEALVDAGNLLIVMAHRLDKSRDELLKEGWEEIRLGEIIHQVKDRCRVEPNTIYSNLGIYSFARGLFHKQPIDGNLTSAKELYRVHKGQFIYSRLFAFEGACGIVTEEYDGCFVSGEYPTFDCDPNRVNPEFLFAYFKSLDVWRTVSAGSKGLGDRRQRVQPEKFLEHKLLLPPLEWQSKITSMMKKIDDLQSIQSATGEELSALLPSVLDRAFKGEL